LQQEREKNRKENLSRKKGVRKEGNYEGKKGGRKDVTRKKKDER
jgi:hypothetical protein